MNEFLLSDESLNSHGSVVRTSGMKLDRFKKNPIMLFMHDRKGGIVGRWEKLRITDNKLYGTPVFDDAHEPGKAIKEKVESGFMKGASVGIENCIIDDIDGVPTVVSCELIEVSICDIPSNQNTLQLYYKDSPVDMPTYLQLTIKQDFMNEQDFKTILQALNLPDDAKLQNVITAIQALKQTSPIEKGTKETLKLAFKEGIITNSEMNSLGSLFDGDPIKLTTFLEAKRRENAAYLSKSFDDYVSSNKKKFMSYSHDFIQNTMKKLALKDFQSFKEMMDKAPEMMLPIDLINNGRNVTKVTGMKLKSQWSLDDYRKNAPQELQRNPDLYQSLLEKEKTNL